MTDLKKLRELLAKWRDDYPQPTRNLFDIYAQGATVMAHRCAGQLESELNSLEAQVVEPPAPAQQAIVDELFPGMCSMTQAELDDLKQFYKKVYKKQAAPQGTALAPREEGK